MKLNHRIIFFSLILFSCPAVYGQARDTTQQEYVIRKTKINFHFGNQNYPYTLFIEPSGEFYFKEKYVDGEPHTRIIFGKKRKGTQIGTAFDEVFKTTTDSIMTVESLYPKFITHDSSFINQYEFDYQLIPFIYELTYSFILHHFGESSLNDSDNKRVVRVILPEHPGCYSIYRFEFYNAEPTLTYKEGKFDSTGTFRILNSFTCIVNEKNKLNIEKMINKIAFEKEYYFLKANLAPKYFIEYRDGQNYYAIERPSHKGKYVGICMALYSASVKCRK